MFRTAFLAAFVAAATAASWPMVTVNSAGNIVLNSPTKAGSFQLNAVTVTSGPTSATTASRSTVTALDSDFDAFIVSVPSSPATSAGYKLPSATEGRTIKFYNSGTGAGAFTIWSSSTSVFFDGTSATSIDILSTTSYVVATATSSTNWVITQNALASNGIINKQYRLAETVTLTSNAVTLTAAQIAGGILTIAPTGAATVTLPTAASMTALDSNSQNGDSYEFSITNTGAVSATAPTNDFSITVTASTGFTHFSTTADTRHYVVPGQTRNYIAYRTSSSAWVLMAKSQYTITAQTVVTGTAGADVVCLTTIATAVATDTTHGITFQPIANGFGVTGDAANFAYCTVINNYAKLGDDCIFIGSTQDTVVTATSDSPWNCYVSQNNQVIINAGMLTAGVTDSATFKIIKN